MRTAEKMKFVKARSIVVTASLLATAFLPFVGLWPAPVSAANNPPDIDPGITATIPSINMDGNNDGGIYATISQACDGYPGPCKPGGTDRLQAPESFAKLYFQGDTNLQVELFEQFGQNNFGGTNNVQFDFYPVDSSENPIGGCNKHLLLSQVPFNNPPNPDYLSDPIDLGFNGGCKPQLYVPTNKYEVQVKISFVTSGHDRGFDSRIRAYCSTDQNGDHGVCVSGTGSKANLAGFWAKPPTQGEPMALQWRNFDQGRGFGNTCPNHQPPYCYGIGVDFGAPCNNSPPSVDITWADADKGDDGAPGDPQNQAIKFVLFKSLDNKQTWSIVKDSETPPKVTIGGDGTKQYHYTFAPEDGAKYVWDWENIVSNNDPQLWIPFDSINYDINCNNQADFNNQPSIQIGSGTINCPSPSGGFVIPGQCYTLYSDVNNTGTIASQPANLIIQKQNPDSVVIPDKVNIGDTQGVPSTSRGYYPPNPNNCGGRDPCWWWNYTNPVLPPGGEASAGAFDFTIDPSANPGDGPVCFQAFVQPGSSNDPEHQDDPVCFAILAQTQPYLDTSQGSVHAGVSFGATNSCFFPHDGSFTSPGIIRGVNSSDSNKGSTASYIVSAGADITNFGSNQDPFGHDLTFGFNSDNGKLGNYGSICRSDIANTLLKKGGTPVGTNVDVTTLSGINVAGGPGQNQVQDVHLSASGTLNAGHAATLVVNGDVYISSDIKESNGNFGSVKKIPTLAIIATGDIFIAPGVKNLYGLYIAGSKALPSPYTRNDPNRILNGYINTCQDDNGIIGPVDFFPSIQADASTCSHQNLVVNGALIANGYYFRRTGGDVEQGTDPAELLTFMPDLTLNPPPGIGSGAGSIPAGLKYAGERPPVF